MLKITQHLVILKSLVLLAGLLGGCAQSTADRTGSETHWLTPCESNNDCNSAECRCGVCTQTCENRADCGAADECSEPGSLAFDMQCAGYGDAPESAGICLPACEHHCGSDELCADGACVVENGENSEAPDASGLDIGTSCESTTDAGKSCEPTTTEAETDPTLASVIYRFQQPTVDKVDLLFVVDNSLGMADKQELLAQALPDLVSRLVDPICKASSGQLADAANGQCPAGFTREFPAQQNIHIAVITSSLGGFGSVTDCTSTERGETDNAHLMGSLPRVLAATPGIPDFLSWCPAESNGALNGQCAPSAESDDAEAFSVAIVNQVRHAGEQGCTWEAPLEAWYRFLIEPAPWTEIVRQNCSFGGDPDQSCVGPAIAPDGALQIDEALIAQRKQFLRPDSLLSIIMLTDENDCSFKATGQSWLLAQTRTPETEGNAANTAFKGTAACATDPNSECCHSCGASPPQGCPTVVHSPTGSLIGEGCEEPRYPSKEELLEAGSTEPSLDAPNLRCFNQKQRFGVDYLYPVARYSNALLLTDLCPLVDDLSPVDSSGALNCTEEQLVSNPLFIDYTYPDRLATNPGALQILPRNRDLVILAGLVGVPWQDLAVDHTASELKYRSTLFDASPAIDWNQLLGGSAIGEPYDPINQPPTDPLMREQVQARSGVHPVTGENVGVNASNSINGHDWNILERDDLQYACTFPRAAESQCPSTPNRDVSCECSQYGDAAYSNPVCDGLTQTHSKAYPSIRQLQVLRDLGGNSVVASVCPKEVADLNTPDFGYRPAVGALIERFAPLLQPKCLPDALPLNETGGAACHVVEVRLGASSCDGDTARANVDAELAAQVRTRLVQVNICDDNCEEYQLCEVPQFSPDSPDRASCLADETASGNGWCYVAPDAGIGAEFLVAGCAFERQRIRFVGEGTPAPDSIAMVVCNGN